MKIQDHLEKVRRLAEFRMRMHPVDDSELHVWSSLNVLMNALNASLHAAGITDEEDAYPYNAVGLYVVPPVTEQGWNKQVRPLGDLIHIGIPVMPVGFPSELEQAVSELRVLEELPAKIIRGGNLMSGSDILEFHRSFDRVFGLIRAYYWNVSGQALL